MPRRPAAVAAIISLVAAITTLVAPSAAHADTDVPAQTLPSGDTIWTPDNSPYVLTGDVTVPLGGNLVIAPGTVVTSASDHQIIVNGEMTAAGAEIDLQGGIVVNIDESVAPAAPPVLFVASTLRNATGAAVHIVDGDVDWVHSSLVDNGTAISSTVDSGELRFSLGEITGNDTVADVYDDLIISQSLVTGYTRGIVGTGYFGLNDSVTQIPAPACDATGTGCVMALTDDRGPGSESSVTGTWFGTDDATAIEDAIWDDADDATLGQVTVSAAASSFDVEMADVSVDAPTGGTLPASGATLTGDATDAGTGVGSVEVWLYDATDQLRWDSNTSSWVPLVPFDVEEPGLVAAGTTTWSADLPDLTAGHEYYAVAFATEQGAGMISRSNLISFTAAAGAGDLTAPTITSASAGADGTATIDWDAPTDDGGVPVDDYDVLCNPLDSPALADLDPVSTTVAAPNTDAQLDLGEIGLRYSCTVTANTSGDSATSAATAVVVTIPATTFTDVPPGLYYSNPAAWSEALGLSTGVAGTSQFQPLRDITRAEVVTMLWRDAGEPTGHPAHGFADTVRPSFYATALDWAKATGLTTGVGGTNNFEPNRQITRAEVVTMLWRYAGEPTRYPDHGFADTIRPSFYAEAVDWGRATGLTGGVGGTNDFQPNRNITRAETVTLLYRAATGRTT